jgi:protein-disulfide isomerase
VARSSWSSVGGVPLAALGLVFYLSLSLLLVLTLLVPDDLRPALAGLAVLGLALGLLVDVYLLGVQAFAVRAFCTVCILTYVLGALALFALLPAWAGARRAGGALARVEGRLAVAGWALGTLAVGTAVLAVESTLDYREQRRQVALLGAPTAARPSPAMTSNEPASDAPTPDPTPLQADPVPETSRPTAKETAEGSDDAAYWKQRAQELQQTLEDPQKLEQYFARKAQSEFENAPVETIDLENAPVKGPPDAPVKVVEYSDFLCPFCRNLGLGLSQFVPQAGGRVAVHFKNYPLDKECNESLPRSSHPGACHLALGAICADYQGKFDAYHDRVFSAEGLRNPGAADVIRLASEAGLNADAMRGCLDDPVAKATLAAHIAEARRLGVNATPTLYVNGKKLPRINDLVPVVDRVAQKSGFPPLRP